MKSVSWDMVEYRWTQGRMLSKHVFICGQQRKVDDRRLKTLTS